MDFTYLDRFLDSLLDFGFPMYDCTVWAHHEQLYRRQGGFIDVAKRRTHEPQTKYFLYSCTKPVTTASALILLEQGKFRLSDPLANYLPEYGEMNVLQKQADGSEFLRPAKTKITILDLFRMSAGLTYNSNSANVKAAIAASGGVAPTREIARAIAKDPLVFDPGERWNYSLCHDVLAALVEVVSGRRFADFVREEIFAPLGMTHSAFHLAEGDTEQMAAQYMFPNESTIPYEIPLRNPHIFGDEYDSGGAGIISTAEDYILFADAMANGGVGKSGARILSPATVDLWRTPAFPPEKAHTFDWDYMAGYEYGLGVRTLVNRTVAGSIAPVGEFGWGGAAGALVYMSPETGVSVYLAQHTRNPREGYVLPALRNTVFACLGR